MSDTQDVNKRQVGGDHYRSRQDSTPIKIKRIHPADLAPQVFALLADPENIQTKDALHLNGSLHFRQMGDYPCVELNGVVYLEDYKVPIRTDAGLQFLPKEAL